MYKGKRMTTRGGSGGFEREMPSFSSSLLNEIYRSIDEEAGADQTREWRLYACSVGGRKKCKCGMKAGEVEKWGPMQRRGHGFDRDNVFFSSTSSYSDSSSNGFSSADTDSCIVPPRPKPVRVRVSEVPEKTGVKTEFPLFHEQKKRLGQLDGEEEMIVKTKSRALSFYSNLMKSKHPISPGGRLVSFINSLFATNVNVRKPKQSAKPVVKSSDSSASSFSRSCLSKFPASRKKLCDGAKRTVRFHPVSMILDKDSRPCGQKLLYPEEDETRYNRPMERSSRVKEVAIEFLRNYGQNQNQIEETANVNAMTSQSSNSWRSPDDVVDHHDDAASCTSSDLFELDHLDVLGNGMYCEELPVYETTNVGTNRAIVSTLMM